jgi:hypothetical protein
MKYLFQLIGIILVFLIFVIGYLFQLIWTLQKPTVTYEKTMEFMKALGDGGDDEYGY